MDALASRPRVPRATYRFQFNASFDLDAAAELADYLEELGVSHVYASPVLQAVPGSAHGYDVVDHTRVSADLGGAAALTRLRAALERHQLGQILDIVPNHMAVTQDNSLWWDVLENGPASHFASFFDVDWDATSDNRVLLPILGEHYFDALEQKLIRIARDGARFLVRYHDHTLPAAPRSIALLLRDAAPSDDELNFWADALCDLPSADATDRESTARRQRDKAVIFAYLERLFIRRTDLAAAVDAELSERSDQPVLLDAWLEQQNWRIAYWRNASTDIGYRRFFDVNSLAGLRVEDARVFERSHRLTLQWLRDGTLDGVRIDHVDGLRDPEAYLRRLREAAPDAYVVVEKILMNDECLPSHWPVDGTTGYEFAGLLDQVFVDAEAELPMSQLSARFMGELEAERQPWAERVRVAKLQILDEVLASERDRLTELALRALKTRIELRDVTRHSVLVAITELLASYPVYRTYVREDVAPRPADAALIASVVARAAERTPDGEPHLWQLLEQALRGELDGAPGRELALRMQQVTGAVSAKAIEDTLFYRDVRLIALNEVGGSPEVFGVSVDAFHRAMLACPRDHSMLASSTHDTKRAEDVRSRLVVLSEIPSEWERAVLRWSARSERYRGAELDRRTEYFFYQTLVGAFPLSVERALPYMQKASREAKLQTSWMRPSEAYEAAVERFVRGVLEDGELLADVEKFVARIAPLGYLGSLARTLIKLTAPGVPDVYQGSELWDLSLVDPDNRRPVDFALRRELLARMPRLDAESALAELERGTPKLWLIWKTLALRKQRPELFQADYRPVRAEGPDAASVIAFSRGDDLVTVVPRFFARGDVRQRSATVKLPAGSFRDVLSGQRVVVADAGISVGALWAAFPAALLERQA